MVADLQARSNELVFRLRESSPYSLNNCSFTITPSLHLRLSNVNGEVCRFLTVAYPCLLSQVLAIGMSAAFPIVDLSSASLLEVDAHAAHDFQSHFQRPHFPLASDPVPDIVLCAHSGALHSVSPTVTVAWSQPSQPSQRSQVLPVFLQLGLRG